MRARQLLVVVLVSVVGTLASAQSRRTDHWVATWASAPVARVPAAAIPNALSTTTGLTPAAPSAAPPAAAASAGAAAAAGRGGRAAAGAQATGAGRGAAPAGRGAPPFYPNDQTLRQIVHVTLGGDRVRVVVTNLFGTTPLRIGAARIALQREAAAIVPGSGHPLTFNGSTTAVVAANADIVSDPVPLAVPNLANLAIDLYVPEDTSKATVTLHPLGVQTNYVLTGNHAGDADMSGASTNTSWYFLSRVDVAAPERTPVIVTMGDSITDGFNSTVSANHRWPDVLSRRLLSAKGGRKIAIVNAGISANRVLSQVGGNAGNSALARFDHDVLLQPGVQFVTVLEAINDIGQARQNPAPSAADLIAGHHQLIERAHTLGIKIYGATLTPFEGAVYFSDVGETKRAAVNEWIRTGKEYDGVIDFDAAVRDPQHPAKYLPQFDSGDHLHPSDAGYEVMGNAVNLALFK